jgi:hypothetical protein
VLLEGIYSGQGYEGTDEYQPNGADRSELPGNPDPTTRAADASATPAQPVEEIDTSNGGVIPVTDSVATSVVRWSADHKSFTVVASRPATLALRLLHYPAWHVQVDGREAPVRAQDQTARMLVDVAAGTHSVDIRFRRTWDRKLGDAISALSCLALLGVAYAGCLLRRRGVCEDASV